MYSIEREGVEVDAVDGHPSRPAPWPDGGRLDLSHIRPFAYLGWDGRGNMGDDAIRLALDEALPGASFIAMAHGPGELARLLASTDRRIALRSQLLVGGGTIIGRRNWRYLVSAALVLTAGRTPLMIGAGVEDPVFQGRHSFSSRNELMRWRPLLGHFDRVTVRGPRSQELLATVGVDATVVGDPALLLEGPAVSAVEPDLLGVCLGFGSDLWSHAQEDVVHAVADVVRDLVQRSGMRIRFFVLNAEDFRWSIECIESAGLRIGECELVLADDPVRFMESVSNCAVLVGQRLHSVVLASVCGVPSVMLEYQPKCRDFMASMGREEWSFRTDQLAPGAIRDGIERLGAERATHSRQIQDVVDTFRVLLRQEVTRIVDVVDTGVPGGR